jgi:lipid-A-disaccharide synthase
MANQTIFIIAGEVSGDRYGAFLIRSLKAKEPSLDIVGLGGPEMQLAGCTLLHNMMSLAVVGIVEVLQHYSVFKRIMKETVAWIQNNHPDVVVFIDYPGFNLRLAKEIYPFNIPLVYYISPQLWAWHKKRVTLMKKWMTSILVIFPFEKDFYCKEGYPEAIFVGHPLLDQDKFQKLEEKTFADKKGIIGLLPGSRVKEIQQNLPVMLEAFQLCRPIYTGVIATANEQCRREIKRILQEKALSISLNEDSYAVMQMSDAVWVASGTATVECACVGVPMIIVYRVSWVTWMIARFLVKIKHIGMVNILAAKEIVPEYIQKDAKPKELAQELMAIVKDEQRYETMVRDLKEVRLSLGSGGASDNAAEAVLEAMTVRRKEHFG